MLDRRNSVSTVCQREGSGETRSQNTNIFKGRGLFALPEYDKTKNRGFKLENTKCSGVIKH